jgi:hypothetical protein
VPLACSLADRVKSNSAAMLDTEGMVFVKGATSGRRSLTQLRQLLL